MNFQEKRDDLINPYWIEDPELKKGEVDFLSPAELSFWKDLIDKYLYPIDANKEEQVKKNNSMRGVRKIELVFIPDTGISFNNLYNHGLNLLIFFNVWVIPYGFLV